MAPKKQEELTEETKSLLNKLYPQQKTNFLKSLYNLVVAVCAGFSASVAILALPPLAIRLFMYAWGI